MARKNFEYISEDGNIKLKLDSEEELSFIYWLEEAKILGIVEDYIYQPRSFNLFDKVTVDVEKKLKTKTKIEKRLLIREHKYTSDFYVWFNKDGINNFKDLGIKNISLLNTYDVYFDIKGGFNSFQSHSNFSVESKWVWNKYKILVEKLIPDKFFKLTWVPERFRYSPKLGKLKKKYSKGYKTFEDIAKKVIDWNDD